MSEMPGGTGWWMASDGRWYPPHLHPSVRPADQPPSPTRSPGLTHPELGRAESSKTAQVRPSQRAPDGRGLATTTRRLWLTSSAVVLLLIVGAGTGVALGMSTGPTLTANEAPIQGAGPGQVSTGAAPATVGGGTNTSNPAGSGSSPGSTTPPSTITTIPVSSPSNVPIVSPATGVAATPITPPPPPASGSLVTPAVEKDVVNSTWMTFADAFAEDDVATLKELSTPSVYLVVTGAFACGCPPWPPQVTGASYSAPPQTSYPISFWAELEGHDYNGTAMTKEIVFTQASAQAPWLVADIGAFWGGQPELGSNVNETDPAPTSPTPIATLANDFAQYLQTVDTTGNTTPSAGVLDDYYLEQTITNTRWAEDQANGWNDRWTHTVQETSIPFALSSFQDSDLACFTMSFQSVVTSANGKPIVQPADQSLFPPLLPAGSYSSVTENGEADTCFVTENGPGAYMLTTYSGLYSVTGTHS
jgi:hypothetical protein